MTVKPRLPPPHPYCFPIGETQAAYIGVPKCGSVSIRHAIKRSGQGRPFEEVAQYPIRFTVIRHPFPRLVSAWRDKWAAQHRDFNNWWEQVRFQLDFDVHTMPYSRMATHQATHVLLLERIEKWWPYMAALFPGDLEPEMGLEHPSKAYYADISMESYRQISQAYEEDTRLWRALYAAPDDVPA